MFATGFVNLYTRDIEAGVRFYRDLLGFRETFRTPTVGTPEHVELTLNGFGIGLGTVAAAKRVHGVEPSPAAQPWSSCYGRTTSTRPSRS
jgi:lactoylglutathione lyase